VLLLRRFVSSTSTDSDNSSSFPPPPAAGWRSVGRWHLLRGAVAAGAEDSSIGAASSLSAVLCFSFPVFDILIDDTLDIYKETLTENNKREIRNIFDKNVLKNDVLLKGLGRCCLRYFRKECGWDLKSNLFEVILLENVNESLWEDLNSENIRDWMDKLGPLGLTVDQTYHTYCYVKSLIDNAKRIEEEKKRVLELKDRQRDNLANSDRHSNINTPITPQGTQPKQPKKELSEKYKRATKGW